MTPFGERVRQLRVHRGVSQKEMAKELGVSAPYLSALERGQRGEPTWVMLQKIIGYFNIIWDEADELIRLARLSHPRITIDTAQLSPQATLLTNRLARNIAQLDDEQISTLNRLLDEMVQTPN